MNRLSKKLGDSHPSTLDTMNSLAAAYRRQGMHSDAEVLYNCLLYTSPSPRDRTRSRMPSSA